MLRHRGFLASFAGHTGAERSERGSEATVIEDIPIEGLQTGGACKLEICFARMILFDGHFLLSVPFLSFSTNGRRFW